MLNELFVKRPTRYLALPLLGAVADDFDTWLSTQGYRRRTRRQQARALVQIDRDLRRQGHRQWGTLREVDLETCWTRHRRQHPKMAATVRVLLRFLQAQSRLPVVPPRHHSDRDASKDLRRHPLRPPWLNAGYHRATCHHGGALSRPPRLRAPARATRRAHGVRRGGLRSPGGEAAEPSHAAASSRSAPGLPPLPGVQRTRAPGPRQSDRYPARLSARAPATQSAVANCPEAVAVH
jgi:hypothetical protein